MVLAFVVACLPASLLLSSCQNSSTRLLGEWELEQSWIFEVPDDYVTPTLWRFEKDGSFYQQIERPWGPVEERGSWNYDPDSAELLLHYQESGNRVLWMVTALEPGRLSVEYTGLGFFVQWTFVKKP